MLATSSYRHHLSDLLAVQEVQQWGAVWILWSIRRARWPGSSGIRQISPIHQAGGAPQLPHRHVHSIECAQMLLSCGTADCLQAPQSLLTAEFSCVMQKVRMRPQMKIISKRLRQISVTTGMLSCGWFQWLVPTRSCPTSLDSIARAQRLLMALF